MWEQYNKNIETGIWQPFILNPATSSRDIRMFDYVEHISMNAPPIAPPGFGSTALSNNIHTYSDLIFYCKTMLGWPVNNIELTDTQWALCVEDALMNWTAWEGNREEEYLIFCGHQYKRGCGVKLDDLFRVGCNQQFCNLKCVTESVTSINTTYTDCGTFPAYLNVSPFVYPTPYNVNDPTSVQFSGISGQFLYLTYDPVNPWNFNCVCDADCITINPINSQWFDLTSNPCLSGTILNFITSPILFPILPSLSGDITAYYPFSAVPLTALGNDLSAIPIDYYDLKCFYPPLEYLTPPLSGCLNIGKGQGYLYPNCDASLIFPCSALTAQFGISPSWIYNLSGSSLSGLNGTFYDLSSLNVSNYKQVILNNIPLCTNNGTIPLINNDGIIASFTLCNTALNTNGPMYINSFQFVKDYTPPIEVLYDQRCNWINNGFTMTYYNSAYGSCIRNTPCPVPVNVSFSKSTTTTNCGLVSAYFTSKSDPGTGRNRKVLGVFSADAGSQAGYGGYGGDLLFNFDYALLASTFGYDLQGTRSAVSRNGYDLLTYHMAKSFVELSRDMLRYVSYQYNPKTQYLKVTPDPYDVTGMGNNQSCADCEYGGPSVGTQCYLIGCYLEPKIEDCLAEYWVREWTIARAMWTLGQIRGMYGNVTLFGSQVLNGDQLSRYSEARMETLLKELRVEGFYGPRTGGAFFIG